MGVKLGAVLLLAMVALAAAAGPPTPPPSSGLPAPAPGHLLMPVSGYVESQPFGCTMFALEPYAAWCPSRHFHSGVDLAARLGTPVHAAAAGRVQVILDPGGYGLHVLLAHGGGLATLYGHMSAVLVGNGAQVSAGQLVGLMGSTGMSTGSHLHFEVRRAGRPVDPAPYLPVHV
ncbi:MAG: M23 family metallopeptidase [Candidatus Dormibacteraeota bacterium]|nr:M23 family metallopeptidase [Candidatus Dormibacteraeota bacterium]MDQ6899830.1 M23 family metallopeptidase [Candidatus Dormibacteraeota bacterium]